MLRTERLLGAMSRAFSIVALILAALGLGGLLWYAVARRTNEFGVRIVLGATPTDITRMILRETGWLLLAGIALGVPAALAVGSLFGSILFGLEAADPPTLAASLAVLLVIATLAVWLPVRRAATIQPLMALRDE
jgi:ABC-type antimicrobial peptide transport system permease subunit